MIQRLEIPDTSDCETCERRHREQWEVLLESRAELLQELTCPECGRTFNLFVREEPSNA